MNDSWYFVLNLAVRCNLTIQFHTLSNQIASWLKPNSSFFTFLDIDCLRMVIFLNELFFCLYYKAMKTVWVVFQEKWWKVEKNFSSISFFLS